MELLQIIRALRKKRAELDAAIVVLERLHARPSTEITALPAKRRGRKSMDKEERKEVSLRMKEYWAARKQAKDALEETVRRAATAHS